MNMQQSPIVRATIAALARKVASPARHVNESSSSAPALDSIALHRWARQQRSRMLGYVIARAWTCLAASTRRVLTAFGTPATKRNRAPM